MKHCDFLFLVKIQWFPSYRPKHDAIYLVQMTMMIGCCAEDTNWRCMISLKSRQNPTSPSHKIPCAWHKDGSQSWCKSWGLNLGLAKRPIEYIFGLGAGPVGLKRACLNTTVRSKYQHQDFATTSWDTIPDLVVNFES